MIGGRCHHRSTPWALSVLAVVVVISLSTLAAPTSASPAIVAASSSPALAPMSKDTQGQLSAIQARAKELRARLDQIHAKKAWANERLGYVRDELAEASSRASLAERRLDALRIVGVAADTELAHRVRAIEQSGGVAPLYAEALGGSSISDVAANIAALQSVIAHDGAAEDAAFNAVETAAALEARLDEVVAERSQLAGQARHLLARVTRLEHAQRSAYRRSSARVQALTSKLERERRAAARAYQPTVTPPGSEQTSTPYADAAVAAALSKLGSPYVWGAEGPETFDCSGLVQWAYLQAGLLLPRLASDQYFAGAPASMDVMQPGDLLVYAYDPSDGETIHHITMYIGNGQMVHAPRTGDVVRIVPVYQDGLYGVARPGL